MVNDLREQTGAGLMDCKRALTETNGNVEEAVTILRKKGAASAAKRADRAANQGLVESYIHLGGKVGVLIEVNCETDFVAKTDNFKAFARNVVDHISTAAPMYVSVEELGQEGDEKIIKEKVLLEQPFAKDAGKIVKDLLSDATVAIGEKIDIRRFVRFEAKDGVVDSYIHMGGKIGVLVDVKVSAEGANNAEFKNMVHDICMHIAAANPKFLNRAEVPNDNLAKEKEILRAQALNEGKPEKIVDKMVEGRIDKYYKEVCLLDQPFVRDPDINIVTLVANTAKAIGTDIAINRFARFERGEGIEKRKDNFAEEIAAEMAKM